MGRRVLPKISSSLDQSRHFRVLQEFPEGWDVSGLFSRTAPLQLEIGTGKGLFLRSAAAGQPADNFLGVEISSRYARYAASHLARLGLDNAIVLQGDGLRLLRQHLTDRSVAAVHVYFPDPWWKKRHHKRRVMTPQCLLDIQRVLQPSGTLHFWTDAHEYFVATLALVDQVTSLRGPLEVAEPVPQHEMDYRTHFERRTRLTGRPVFRARFVRP
jgi:tRNA (guanine-N7-)-methyltransferase